MSYFRRVARNVVAVGLVGAVMAVGTIDSSVEVKAANQVLSLQESAQAQVEQPITRYTPFLYTQSEIVLPNRRLTDAERQVWINEYNENGGASAFELEVIELINEIRVSHRLRPLEIDETLMMAARFYTQTMANLDLPLGHREGPYGGARYTARAFGFEGSTGGTSYWGRWTAQDVVAGWMNSPGHRNLILDPGYSRAGFGSHLGGEWGVFHYMIFS